MQRYLRATDIMDAHHPEVIRQAKALAQGRNTPVGVAQACFEFVRDQIAHSWDARLNPVTCKASDVLTHRTGYCYAKSHLLAALLRANQIPAGLCYQRVSVGDGGAPYCLHGLNAIHLPQWGWYRVDARGNKPGVNAQFKPPHEQLAFPIREAAEADLPEIWADPLPIVIETLTRYLDITDVANHLPDIDLWARISS
jgi:transglutaminase-like putative cysteine protease